MKSMNGPLRVSTVNPRYFTDDSGKAIYLTGMHIHAAFQDNIMMDGTMVPGMSTDYDAYLDDMVAHNHNFLRFWSRESGFSGGPRARNGQMTKTYPALYVDVNTDGLLGDHPVYDLDQMNDEYFVRLYERVKKAGERGIYCGVMLFEGWSLDTRSSGAQPGGWPYKGHPFHKDNNINGIDGNPDMGPVGGTVSNSQDSNPFCPAEHLRVHTLDVPEITAYQKKYVKRVVETLNDLDNVLYEISNESFRWSRYWQYEMIRYIHALEKELPKQHPVWMSHLVQAQNESLYVSEAEAISPGVEDVAEPYCINPPASDGRKVIIADTDHLGGFWGTSQWAWKSFLRGINPIFMDFWGPMRNNGSMDKDNPMSDLFGRREYMLPTNWGEPVRVALGQTRSYAEKIDLSHMIPYNDLCSTSYCLANPGHEYLVYAPEAGQSRMKLFGAPGPFAVEWFNPNTGETFNGPDLTGGAAVDITPPYLGEIVLYLKEKEN